MTIKFEDLIQNANQVRIQAEALRRTYEEQVSKAKKLEEEKGQALTRLNRIAYLANCTRNTMDWMITFNETNSNPHPSYAPWATKKCWELNTSLHDFHIWLIERTDLKRDKWEVQVRVWERTLSADPNSIHGGYTDHGYGKEKYANAIDSKYRYEEDALKAVGGWMAQLMADHLDEITEERELRTKIIREGFTYDDRRKFY
jgi:hypothetical protein